jgi:hypothetical protein
MGRSGGSQSRNPIPHPSSQTSHDPVSVIWRVSPGIY